MSKSLPTWSDKTMFVNTVCIYFVFVLAILLSNQPIDCVLAVPLAISTDDDFYERPIVISSAHQDPRKSDSLYHPHLSEATLATSSPILIYSSVPSASPSTDTPSALSSSRKVYHLPPSSSDEGSSSNVTTNLAVNEQINSTKSNSTNKIGRSDEKITSISKTNSSSLGLSSYGLSSVDLIQPLTLLLMSYLSSRHALKNSNNYSNHNHFIPQSGSRNSENESRTLASWLSNLAKRLKWRGQQPNRRDNSGPPPTTEDVGGQSVPIPYESVHQVSMNHRVQPAPSGPNSVVFSNLIPQPEGFPGPMNPDSILLPPDLVENSGIKYWLDLIERTNGDEMQSAFQTAGSDNEDISYGQVRLNRRNRVRPSGNKSRLKPFDIPKIGFSHTIENHDRNSHQSDDENDVGRGDGFDSNKVNPPPISDNQSPRCDKFTAHICVDDFEYPEQAIIDEIYKRRDVFELMYSEVKGDAPLVDGIPREVEESYTYDSYTAPNEVHSNDDSKSSDPMSSGGDRPKHGLDHGSNRNRGAGFICPSEVLYGKPKLARNIRGDWKVIVNAGEFTQTVRMEKCLRANDACNYIRDHEVSSRCAQVHSFHRLMVFEKGKGFYIDTFRIPTACTCHISKKSSGPNPMSGLIDAQSSQSPNTPHLSNTLWSILGGNHGHDSVGSAGSGTGSHGISPFSSMENANSINRDLLKTQLNVLETLKNYPQLSGQISQDNLMQNFNSNDGISNHLNSFSDKSFNSNQPSLDNVMRTGSGTDRTSDSNMAHHDSESNHESGSNHGDSAVEYLLPGMMYAEEPLSFPTQDSGGSPMGGGSYGSGTSGSSGAPLVQVIHVPITSSVPQNYPIFKQYGEDYGAAYASASHSSAESLKSEGKNNYFDDQLQNGHSHGVVNRHRDDVGSDGFHFPRMNNNTNDSASLAYEANLNTSTAVSSEDPSISNYNSNSFGMTRRNTMEDDASSQRINFSYHPILEYIQKPSNEEGERSRAK